MTARRRPVFARLYARVSHRMEEAGVAEQRRELLAGLSGRVIEVGAGNGLSFRHYPPTVTEVLALEPEPHLRRLAEDAARLAPVPVTVRDAEAGRLPAADGEFDAGVASLVLCSVPDQQAALAEFHRVIRPGGELRFYEHVLAETNRLARVQRAVDIVWPWFAGGCHTSRDTVAAITAAGFEIRRMERFRFPEGVASPASPHVLGVAVRRAG